MRADGRRRRPISERSRAELGATGRIAFSLCLHAVGSRPSLTVSATGRLPGAWAPAPPGGPSHVPSVAEQALLAAIYAAPDDDAARLAYADLLCARGDPRGELVALQLRRARGEAAPRALAREQALLRAHAAEWLGPLARVAAGGPSAGWQQPARWTRESAADPGVAWFARGFPERLALGGPRWLYEVLGEPAWATLRALELAPAWAPADTLALVTEPALCRLRELDDATEPVLLRLADEPLRELRRMSLHDPRDTSGATRELLARFPALRSVELRSWRPEVARAPERFAPPALDELVLATTDDALRPALEGAQTTAVRSFVFSRRTRDGHFRLAFSRDEALRLSVLTLESCAGEVAVDVAVETLDRLPVELVSRATVRGSELAFPPRLRHALRRFG
ncbi:MAG: TIGR02996 domain-containing protein [Polyangiaceae bacterium]|nr:TIGR02996 domain-containing protein [Polyangiaceae bacterium]